MSNPLVLVYLISYSFCFHKTSTVSKKFLQISFSQILCGGGQYSGFGGYPAKTCGANPRFYNESRQENVKMV
jgi:hypothetical protein